MSPANEKMLNIEINKSYKDLILLGFYSFYFYLFLWFLKDLGQKLGQKKSFDPRIKPNDQKQIKMTIYSVPLFELNV